MHRRLAVGFRLLRRSNRVVSPFFYVCFGLACFARMPASACACCLCLLLRSESLCCLRTAEKYREILGNFPEKSRKVHVRRACVRAFVRTFGRDLSEIL